jgi:hypothetical protein
MATRQSVSAPPRRPSTSKSPTPPLPDERIVVDLAIPHEPFYDVDVPRCTDDCPRDPEFGYCTLTDPAGHSLHNEYDDGLRQVGNLHANATLMPLLQRAIRDDPYWRNDALNLLSRLTRAGVY